MEKKTIELKSPKVRNIIGKISSGLIIIAVIIYVLVTILLIGIVFILRTYNQLDTFNYL